MGDAKSIPDALGMVAPLRPRVPLDADFDNNPFHLGHMLRQSHPALYQLRVQVNSSEEGNSTEKGQRYLTFLEVSDLQEFHRVLQDTEVWVKGKGTFEPFRSIVPKHVLAIEGELHRKLRRAGQQALSEQIQSNLFGIVTSCAQAFERRFFQPAAASGKPITTLDKHVRAFSLDIISSAVFGEAWNALDDYSESNPKAFALSEAMHTLHWRVTDLNQREWRQDPGSGGLRETLAPLHSFIQQSIEERKKSPKADMLSFWITEHPQLDDDELQNLCLTFLTMGHENVASALSWTMILLAENGEQQQQVREEIRAFKPLAEIKSVSELQRGLERTEAFFLETMRLYPSVPVLNRMAKKDTEVCGFKVVKGTELTLNLYSYHRDSRVWGDNAEAVDFTRHLPGTKTGNSAHKCPALGSAGFAPFGGGDRTCIGRPLSYLQVKVLLLTILPKYLLTSTRKARTQPNNFVSFRPGKHSIKVTPTAAKL